MPLLGDPNAVEEACRELAAAATAVQSTGDSVAGHGRSITADWTGLAAPLALARTQQDAANAQRVAQAAHDAVGPLTRYAEELRAAQQDYARGEEMAAQGRAATSGLVASAGPAADTARGRADQAVAGGTALMQAAEERVRIAGEAAARALDAASSSLAGIAPPPAPSAAASTPPMADVGNAVASLGMAALEHPLDVAAVVGGGTLTALGVTGVVAGAVASLTGGGALFGVPGAAASAGGVAAGVGLAGAGLVDLASHAAADSAVAPFQVNQDDDSHVIERARTVGEPGRNKRVRVVETEEEVRALYDELSEGGTPIERRGYDGKAVVLPGGTEVGLRETSKTNDVTVDVQPPNGRRMKVHRK